MSDSTPRKHPFWDVCLQVCLTVCLSVCLYVSCMLDSLCRLVCSYLCVCHRHRSGWNSGGTHGEGRRWIDAEWGRVCGGVSPLQPTRGYGGASWAAPAGPSPRPKTDFGVFWRPQNAHFCTYMTKSAGDNLHYRSPYSKFWGDASPLSPSDLCPWCLCVCFSGCLLFEYGM